MNGTYVLRATSNPIANELMSEGRHTPIINFYKDVRVSFTFRPLVVLIKVYNCFSMLTHIVCTHKI
jgi:hypothetical protein